MSDQELRTLERAAAADPGQTLAYVRALERAGRADEGWLALCQAIDEPTVQAELARRPVWSDWMGPGASAALDVPPLRSTPRARWVARVRSPVGPLCGGPLGVLAGHEETVFDPRDGRRRLLLEPGWHSAWMDGPLVVAQAMDPARLLVWSLIGPAGEEVRTPEVLVHGTTDPALYDLPPAGQPLPGRGRALTTFGELLGLSCTSTWSGADGRVVAWPAVATSRAQRGPRPPSFHALVHRSSFATTRHPGTEHATVTVFDLERLEPVWEGPGELVALDASGALVHRSPDQLVLVDAGGRTRWSRRASGCALGPELVLASVEGEGLLLDRRSGAVRARLDGFPGHRHGFRPSSCLVRDVIVAAAEERVLAWSATGEPLWALDVCQTSGLDSVWATDLVPLPGALVVSLDSVHHADDRRGALVCLEASPGASP